MKLVLLPALEDCSRNKDRHVENIVTFLFPLRKMRATKKGSKRHNNDSQFMHFNIFWQLNAHLNSDRETSFNTSYSQTVFFDSLKSVLRKGRNSCYSQTVYTGIFWHLKTAPEMVSEMLKIQINQLHHETEQNN